MLSSALEGQVGNAALETDSQLLFSTYAKTKYLLGIIELSMFMAVAEPVLHEPVWSYCGNHTGMFPPWALLYNKSPRTVVLSSSELTHNAQFFSK